MTKLQEIIDAATGDSVPAAMLLRMVRVVATRLGTAPLEEWVAQELNGYKADAVLPDYRGPFDAAVMGLFVGPRNIQSTLPIPPVAMHESYRSGPLFKVTFRESVSGLQVLAANPESLGHAWPDDAVVLFNHLVDKGEAHGVAWHGLVQAWKPVSSHLIAEVLDQVRTRVLTLALDLEKIAPTAGEVGARPVDATTVNNVVNNNIYGDGNAIAVNSADAAQQTHVVKRGNLDSLLAAAREANLPEPQVIELEQAVKQDAAAGVAEEPGPAVQSFMGRLALGAASTTGQVATGAAGGTVAALIKAYLGF